VVAHPPVPALSPSATENRAASLRAVRAFRSSVPPPQRPRAPAPPRSALPRCNRRFWMTVSIPLKGRPPKCEDREADDRVGVIASAAAAFAPAGLTESSSAGSRSFVRIRRWRGSTLSLIRQWRKPTEASPRSKKGDDNRAGRTGFPVDTSSPDL